MDINIVFVIAYAIASAASALFHYAQIWTDPRCRASFYWAITAAHTGGSSALLLWADMFPLSALMALGQIVVAVFTYYRVVRG